MNILYVGDLYPGMTANMRLQVLRELGHQVVAIDVLPPAVARREKTSIYRVARKVFGRMDLAGANAAIVKHLRSVDCDVLWLDKALTIWPQTLRVVKTIQPTCRIIGYSMDDMNARHNQSRHFLKSLPLHDAYFTTKTYGVAELRNLGCPRVEFTGNAFDIHTHRPVELSAEDRQYYGADVGFVGTFEQERAGLMNFLAEKGIPVQIFGNEWGRWPNPHASIKIRHQAIYGDPYAKAICAARINLCFLRKINRDLQTTRSIEIPACGAFMLAERTEEHLALFEEGQEAEFFSTPEELLSKTRYYLAHSQERERIAAAGRERCLRSEYSYHDRLEKILTQVTEATSMASTENQA